MSQKNIFSITVSCLLVVTLNACNATTANHGVRTNTIVSEPECDTVKHKKNEICSGGILLKVIQYGKDGEVWLLQANNNKVYEVLFSIPNLGDDAALITDLKQGRRVVVSGQVLRQDKYSRIVAKSLGILMIN